MPKHYLTIAISLITALKCDLVQANNQIIDAIFPHETNFSDCKADLLLADANNDGSLNRNEWKDFINLQSNGNFNINLYEDMPLTLIELFTRTACSCLAVEDNSCCSGDDANINLNMIDSKEGEEYYSKLCSSTELILGLHQESFSMCTTNLFACDKDEDGKVNADEWTTFVNLQSGGSVGSTIFKELPLPYISLFTSTACLCMEVEGNDSSCCMDNQAHIDLSIFNVDDVNPYFTNICGKVEQIIQYQEPNLHQCKNKLDRADEDNDGKINADEFVSFMNMQSKGGIRFDSYQDLPLSYVAFFTTTACECRVEGDNLCCLDDNAKIDLNMIQTRNTEIYFVEICAQIEEVIKLQEASFLTCKNDFFFADQNENGEIDWDEFTSFVNIHGGGRNYVDLVEDLNGPFTDLFTSAACVCPETKEMWCCLDNTAHFDLQLLNDGHKQTYFFEFCAQLEQKIKFQVHQFQKPNFLSCKDDLLFADEDNDAKIDANEFMTFVMLRSRGGIISDQYKDLPLPFIMLFTDTACVCLETEGPVSSCCLRESAHIDLQMIDGDERQQYFFTFCSKFDQALADLNMSITTSPSALLAPSPTPSQTQFPSNLPSQAPPMDEVLQIIFTYGIVVDAALSAEDILTRHNNTVSEDLITATTTVMTRILNETYPCTSENAPKRRRTETVIANKNLDLSSQYNMWKKSTGDIDLFQAKLSSQNEHRYLRVSDVKFRSLQTLSCSVFYTDEMPVTIVRVVDDICDSLSPDSPNNGCSIVRSVVTVIVVDKDLNQDDLRDSILNGLRRSFIDGSFMEALP